MTMTIVHFSDWHGSWSQLPWADIYVCTGDMYPNLMLPHPAGRRVSAAFERDAQKLWLAGLGKYTGGFRKECMLNPDAPVVCVRGNHDFTSLAPLFGGEVYELNNGPDDNCVEIEGVMFAGVRGVPRRHGEWSDEILPGVMKKRLAELPVRVDVLVTHTPALNHLDYPKDKYHDGCAELHAWLHSRRRYPPLAHCFGHAHFHGGETSLEDVGNAKVLFSNAATSTNEFKL